MSLFMAGIDHYCAGLDVRGRFSLTQKQMEAFYGSVMSEPKITGCILISTCNRFEIWLNTQGSASVSPVDLLCERIKVDAEEVRGYFRVLRDETAVDHIFHVACGLESKIIGEDQIITQVNNALTFARHCHATDAVLETLFRKAVTTGKRVRTETRLNASDRSVAHTALRLFREKGFDLNNKHCMVSGSGMMGKAAAQALLAYGAKVRVTVRKYKNGIADLPAECQLIDYDDRLSVLSECDLVISATKCHSYTLQYEALKALHPEHPIRLIDLAVPRDIDPAANALDWAELYDIDSFGIDPHSDRLLRETEKANGIIGEEEADFYRWMAASKFSDAIGNIKTAASDDLVKRLKASPAIREDEALSAVIASAAERTFNHILYEMRTHMDEAEYQRCLAAMDSAIHEWKHT